MPTLPVNFSDDQLIELLRLAAMIQDDRARDRYFERAAAILRGHMVSDMSVRCACNQAFAAEQRRAPAVEHVEASDACVLGRAIGGMR
jgi:hypothetical protein